MNRCTHIFSFSTLTLGIVLLYCGIYFMDNIEYPFVSPISGIAGISIFVLSFVIFEYENQHQRTNPNINSFSTVSV